MEEVKAGPVVEEVRFAVVMYGGIALCIYMSGITDILLDMVLATARGDDPNRFLKEDLLTGTQRVLRKAAQLRAEYRRKEISEITSEEVNARVDCKFVIDILSGTSAGGINNVFLARALACEKSLEKLASLWVEEGDISTLLNDEGSRDTGSGIAPENPPQSLLNSLRMQQRLFEAFSGMKDFEVVKNGSHSRLVDKLDLYVTSTDLEGLDVSLSVIAGTPAKELRNRTVFHMAYETSTGQTKQQDGSKCKNEPCKNDFTDTYVPFLSFVSRATSCIVPAFEPIKLGDLNRLSYGGHKNTQQLDIKKYYSFFPGYTDSDKDPIIDRFFGDGGYTDNYPFGPAIDAIQARRSNVSVDRILLYVEPDPEIENEDSKTKVEGQRPTVFRHITAALSAKTTEKIREDVAKVRARSELLERMKYGLRAINDNGSNIKSLDSNQESLRQTVVVDYLADTLYDQAQAQKMKVERRTLFWLVQGMFLLPPPITKGNKEPAPENANKGDLLNCFDFETVRRKIAYLKRHIDDKLLRSKSKCDPNTEALLAVRQNLSNCSTDIDRLPLHNDFLISFVKEINIVSEPKDPDNPDFEDRIKSHIFGAKKRDEAYQEGKIKTSSETFKKLKSDCLERFQKTNAKIDDCAKTLDAMRDQKDLAEKGPLLRRFEVYDRQALPMLYGIEGVESTWITLCRVSPLDSKTLESDPVLAKEKLAGAGLGHFGGFFKDMWRVHDILWGRLDAIENVIKTVIPQDCLARRELIFQGQIAVIQEFKLDANPEASRPIPACSTIKTMRGWLLRKAVNSFLHDIGEKQGDTSIDTTLYKVSSSEKRTPDELKCCIKAAASKIGLGDWYEQELRAFVEDKTVYKKVEMDPNESIQIAGRSLNVLGEILGTVPVPKKVPGILLTSGRILVAIGKILTPGSIQGKIAGHWLGLAILINAILLTVGIFWGPALAVGLRTTLFTVGAYLTVRCIDLALKPGKGLKAVLLTISGYGLASAILALSVSGHMKKWLSNFAQPSTNTEPLFEKWWQFVSNDIGIKWSLFAAGVTVIYIAYCRLADLSMRVSGVHPGNTTPSSKESSDNQDTTKKHDKPSKLRWVPPTLTLLVLFAAIPATLLYSSPSNSSWSLAATVAYPVVMFVIIAAESKWGKK